MFDTQVLVTKELTAVENLYLKCLTNQLNDQNLIQHLADDYKQNQNNEIYTRYLNQLTRANTPKEGNEAMICEGLFELYGTSSKEIAEKATLQTKKEDEAIYLPKISKLEQENASLRKILAEHGISVENA